MMRKQRKDESFEKYMGYVLRSKRGSYPKSKHKIIKSDEGVLQIETDWHPSEDPMVKPIE